MLKKYATVIAIIFTILLAIASFIKMENIPETGLSLEDKLFHFTAYTIFTFVWYNCFVNTIYKGKINRSIFIAVLLAIIYGIIVEVLQGQLTVNRVTEFNDAIANSFGAIFAALIIKLKASLVKKY